MSHIVWQSSTVSTLLAHAMSKTGNYQKASTQFGRPLFELHVKADYFNVRNSVNWRGTAALLFTILPSSRMVIFEKILNLCTFI